MRMRPLSRVGAAAAGMLICLGAAGVVLAQDESNPPGRVAQLSYAQGSVSLEPAGTDTWTSATLNRPLTIGDRLWTDEDSRAELDIGDAVIRLGSTTGVSFLNLDEQTAQLQVSAGTVIVHVDTLASDEQDEIDTPDLALTLEQPGTYRVEVSDSGDTTIVKVDAGEAVATGGGESFRVAAQQSVTFTGTSMLTADYATLGAPDSLDDWSMQRDQEEQQQAAVAQQYVSPEVVGADDLGSYGTWQETADWGYAWFPAVAVGWAPYSMGNWAWVSPWGWTWVDEEPWGFAPFHYGRWGYWHRRWCWIPGPRHKRPMYAPALVGWVGGRDGGRASAGARVGWFPLGPHDVYVPGHHVSAAYVRNINLANTRANATSIARAYEGHDTNLRYANSGVPGAVTAVPRNVFTSAQPVGPHRVILPHRGGMSFRATTAAPAIMPVRESVLGMHAGRVVRAPPRAIADRPVVARLAPPRAPVAFAREQAAMRANGGRPLPMATLARLRPNTPAAPVRLVPAPAVRRPGVQLRTAPGNRSVPNGYGMSARERALQQPTLPPARAPRNDRPAWAQQRQAPLEWRSPPQQQAAPARQAAARPFMPPPRQRPQERFAPPERQIPEPRFAPPARSIQEPRFAPPARSIQEPRFTPPPRQVQEPRFTAPPRPIPQQRFAPPSYHPMPRAAPARPPEARPAERPPEAHPRADAAPLSFGRGYAEQPPPPMYRPVPVGHGVAAPAQLGSRRLAGVGARRIG